MFTKKKVLPLRDIVAVWKFDGIVGGVTILSNTHGEISFTIPMNRDRVFAVLEFLLKMHKTENNNTVSINDSNANNYTSMHGDNVGGNIVSNVNTDKNNNIAMNENENAILNPNILDLNMLGSSSTSGSGSMSQSSNSMHNSGGSGSTTAISGDDGSFLGTTPPNIVNIGSRFNEMGLLDQSHTQSRSMQQQDVLYDNDARKNIPQQTSNGLDDEQHAQWL